MYFLDLLIAASAGALVGLLVGRRNSRDRLRCRELETELTGARADAARYRDEVATHFSKTSELVRGLTLQYRAVYDHLADGARTLCPERTMELAEGHAALALASESAEAEEPAAPEPAREPETAAAAH
ncbi:MAG: DUF1043 family protein [Deltaproteobacteria bacterium]|nr:DUF1043 family protein [Deltaproteobacteria bacterium]